MYYVCIGLQYKFILYNICIRLSEKFLSFYEEIVDAQRFLFYIIIFCRITYGPFCSVEINTATFHRFGFTFV